MLQVPVGACEVLKRRSPRHVMQQKTQETPPPFGGLHTVHAINKQQTWHPCAECPLLFLLFPCGNAWKVMVKRVESQAQWCRWIEMLPCYFVKCKPCTQSSVKVPVKYGRNISALLKQDGLMPFQVHSKPNDIGVLLVQIKAIQTVASLRSWHIPTVLVDLDLIPHAWLSGRSIIKCSSVHRANVHLCTVLALIDVLVKIFHNRDEGANLHVDVVIEEQGQVRVVGHHPTVVKGKPTPVATIAKQQLLCERCHRSINASMAT